MVSDSDLIQFKHNPYPVQYLCLNVCIFLISPIPRGEQLTLELINSTLLNNSAPGPFYYRVLVPIPL